MIPGTCEIKEKQMCKQEGGAMLIVGKVELEIKSTHEYKEIHHMMQGIFYKEDIIVINMYVANNTATKYKGKKY